MSYKLYSDGGSRGNPGNAASGFVIFNNNELVDLGGFYLGIKTNNHAEYMGLIEGLKLASKHTDSIECFLDSELVVKQLNGQYKVSNAEIKVLFNKVKDVKMQFKTVTFTHVRREQNKITDKIVNTILDATESAQNEKIS